MSQARIKQHLEQAGHSGTADEFRDALLKFGHDDEAVEALHNGLKKHIRDESFSDYTTSSTHTMTAKKKLLQDFDLRRGVFKDFNTASAKPDTLDELRTQVAELTARLKTIEDAPRVHLMQKIQLKKQA